MWAFATVDQSDAPLFALVAKAAQLRVAELKAQNLANAAWAFAKMGLSETPVLPVIMARAAQALSGFRCEELRMTLWSLSRRESLIAA